MIPRTVQSIENRIAKLSIHPVENEKLIKKWRRLLRKISAA
jgi:hypothetical protein